MRKSPINRKPKIKTTQKVLGNNFCLLLLLCLATKFFLLISICLVYVTKQGRNKIKGISKPQKL